MFDNPFYTRKDCRVCGSKNLTAVLDLGRTPLANTFVSSEQLGRPEPVFPLSVHFCQDCFLLMLRDIVHPSIVFGKDYPYLTSASKPLADHFINLGTDVVKKFIRSKSDLVVEIGSNDGVLLESIKGDCRVLGVDPSEGVAEIARQKGVETLTEFFSKETAKYIKNNFGAAKVIVANNVIAHIDNIREVFEGVKILLEDNSVFIFEVHWVGNLISDGGFDQIYHEHLSYFSLTALKRLAEISGMILLDVEFIPIHGQSLRVYVSKGGPPSSKVKSVIEREKEMGLNKFRSYQEFAARVFANRRELQGVLKGIKKAGKTIAGYGAPAKGNTLLNYCGIDRRILDYIVDSTSFKQGLYTPGTHIPVCHPEKFKKQPPDYMLLLAWNYKDAILAKEKWFSESGGKWIIPVPKVRIV